MAYLLGGLPDRSVPLLLDVIEHDPANEAARWYLVLALTWTGQLEETIEAGESYFERFGDDDEIHAWVGVAQDLLGHHDRAGAHYEKARSQANASSASNPTFLGLLFGGLLHDRLGDGEEAEKAWRTGAALAESKLRNYEDNIRMRLFLACFCTLLGERTPTDEALNLTPSEFNPWDIYYLAAVLARVGEAERAIELLRGTVRKGRISPHWKPILEVAGVPPFRSESFDRFLGEYEAEERRLRETY